MRISDWSSDVCSSDLVGMILGIRNHARDDASLLGDPQPLFVAQGFKVDRSGHAGLSCKLRSRVSSYLNYSAAAGIEQGRRLTPPPRSPSAARPCSGLAPLAPAAASPGAQADLPRSEEHTSELQSLMRLSYAVFCLKQKKENIPTSQRRT